MKLIIRLFSRQEIHAALFGLGCLLFTWPMLSDRLTSQLDALFLFLFAGWSALIAGVALASWAQSQSDED